MKQSTRALSVPEASQYPQMQGLDHVLPGPFLRVHLSDPEGRGSISLWDRAGSLTAYSKQ